MALRIPPALLALLAAVVIAVLPRAAGLVPAPLRLSLSAGLALAGGVMCALAVAHFRKARTTVNPLAPEQASALVISGIYRYSRNPMYLGFALMLLAWVVFLLAWPGVLVIAAFVLYLNRFQIRPEELALTARFGAAFHAYQSSVRRWL